MENLQAHARSLGREILGSAPERIEIRDRLRPGHTKGRSASGTDQAASDQHRRGEESPAWQTHAQRALDATMSRESGAREPNVFSQTCRRQATEVAGVVTENLT